MKGNFNLFKEEIRGKKVAVVGIGISNIPLIEFLLKLGAEVSAFDKRPIDKLDERARAFEGKISFSLGDGYLEGLRNFDYVFRTPGMRPDNPYLERVKKEGAIVTSEMQEFIRYCKGHIIGVTGSDGKSTTTTLIYEILKESGKNTYIGGNIGFPLFSKVEEIKEEDYVVVELSSFQLMDMGVSPEVAVVTNLSPNHLDVHKDMEEYIEAKKNIFNYQGEKDLLILNEDNEITRSFKKEARGRVLTFSSKGHADASLIGDEIILNGDSLIDRKKMKIRGIHNAENFMAASLATYDIANREAMVKVGITFPGVKHRCQFIREIKGASFYNDSIASSPTRTLATVKSFPEKKGKINVILGGYDKNLDFNILFKEGVNYLNNIIIYGASSEKIKESLVNCRNNLDRVYMAKTFEEACDLLVTNSKEGEVGILSPACASFDLFKNFEERGNYFKDIILKNY